ncbi:excitatory amino acid transporter isoform X1 [Danaus plexippus]|uniref:excitatory amino acid transporter isoform X1 n=2 Tax=Danaus plexippus TaxID=13037 RepID=UPI0013C4BB16|nr:excitatory amino acid transporter isoform X1 [Danaus plexippus]XP_061380433.1 excitatory amino acid transporter isoform X1 [Danaus plexippus]
MEKSGRFSEYLFVKMGPGDRGPKTTEDRSAPIDHSGVKKWLLDNTMLVVTLAGVITGIAIGFGLRPYHLGPDALMIISYPGELFMRLLKLMILPLIIASLIAGSASLNAKMSGKIAIRTLLYFILTSMFNAFLGILLSVMIHPGKPELKDDFGTSFENKRDHSILDSLLDIGRNIFPDNIVQAAFQQAHTVYAEPKTLFAKNATENGTEPVLVRDISYRSGTNTLGLVFFCLVFGSLLGTLGPKGKVVIDFFQAIFEVIMKMVTGVMWFTPVGVSSVIAGKILGVSNVGQVMSQLAWFIATVAVGIFLYQLIVMQLIYFIFLRRNPYKFYWGLSQAMLTASATASTAAALPVTFRAMEGPLNIDSRITRFVLPIGCNINMDGTALFLAVASVFVCQMNNLHLGFAQLATIFLTSTAASVSSASVPSAAMVLLLVVLAAVDAPTHDVSLLFAVDWLVDRIRTTNNMLGDCYAAAVVEKLSKNELMACDAASMDQSLPNGLPTSNTELEIGIVTPGDKSIASDDVIIDMHLHNTNRL